MPRGLEMPRGVFVFSRKFEVGGWKVFAAFCSENATSVILANARIHTVLIADNSYIPNHCLLECGWILRAFTPQDDGREWC